MTGARAALRLLFAAVLALGAHAAAAQPTDRGFFLVAKPSLLDPNFQHTVVLVTNAPDGATLGVIINRPTRQSLASILPGNPTLARFTEPLYFGGPVERVGLFAVFRAKETPGQSLPAGDDLHLALHPTSSSCCSSRPNRSAFSTASRAGRPGSWRTSCSAATGGCSTRTPTRCSGRTPGRSGKSSRAARGRLPLTQVLNRSPRCGSTCPRASGRSPR